VTRDNSSQGAPLQINGPEVPLADRDKDIRAMPPSPGP
jgi:hypothetical protein